MAKAIYIRTRYVNSASSALLAAIHSYNSVIGEYRKQQSLILMTNAVELLAKAVLLKLGESIRGDNRNPTIPAEKAISKLLVKQEISEIEAQTIQQLISFRNEAAHSFLPEIPNDILQHVIYCAYKTFNNLARKHFRNVLKITEKTFLSISFEDTVTYADGVSVLIKKYRKNTDAKKLLWLLERGVSYSGSTYMSQDDFERKFKNGRRLILDRLNLSNYMKDSEQLKVVFIQAPRGYTVNVDIRKGNQNSKQALPVVMTKKTEVAVDYPYLTTELATKLGKGRNVVVRTAKVLNMRGDNNFHQEIKVGKKSFVQRYSEAAYVALKKHFESNPVYIPLQTSA
ncbi:MAG: hypothetical protein HZA81_03075 [Candidatus Taylorbacteria bacterium]|nr:hypothetical protein [Candidatus Taylorbacteria bacterium]